MSNIDHLLLKIKTIPEKSGVYLFKDKDGKIIYVGKAKRLNNRIRSYFQEGNNDRKNIEIRRIVNDFEFIITETETEALILENNLIKKHRPRFNVQFRDDKTYPFLRITIKEEYPRVEIVRRRKDDGQIYFGPYTSMNSLREVLKQALEIFPIASCKKNLEKARRKRPCLYYQIDRCLGPCVHQIDKERYNKLVNQMIDFFNGKQDTLIKELTDEMNRASEKLAYEMAAKIRDRIVALKKVNQRQRMVSKNQHADYDFIELANKEDMAIVQILEMREGKIIAQKHFTIKLPFEIEKSEILSRFVQQYYSQKEKIGNKIITKDQLSDEDLLNNWLKAKVKNEKQEKIIIRPKNTEEIELIKLANENAEMKLESTLKIARLKEERIDDLLEKVAKTLGLEQKPLRIEGYDISTLRGTNTVASRVVFEEAKPKRSDYRRFSIRTIDNQDDFASIREVIKRRFTGSLGEEKKPDLILIDGGVGQVSSAATILKELEIDIPLIGLAKEFEEIYFSDKRKPLRLEKRDKALQLLQQIRDEAHRYAITYHRNKRAKKMLNSSLEKIPGLGKKKIELLLKHFLTIKNIKKANIEELTKVKGINSELALKIIDYFRSEETTY